MQSEIILMVAYSNNAFGKMMSFNLQRQLHPPFPMEKTPSKMMKEFLHNMVVILQFPLMDM